MVGLKIKQRCEKFFKGDVNVIHYQVGMISECHETKACLFLHLSLI